MGMDPVTLGLAGAGVAGVAGAMKGGKGTPKQQTLQDSTSQTTLTPMTGQQQSMMDASQGAYNTQKQYADQLASGIGGAQNVQDAARQQAMSIMNGSAMQATPQEQALIGQTYGNQLAQGKADINQYMADRIGAINTNAGMQGMRGQALSELQGRAAQADADQYGSLQRTLAGQQAQATLNQPYQRIAAQSPYIQQGMSFADQMRQQAISNQQQLQNPYLLQMLQQERLATGKQVSSGSQTAPQHGGGFADALMGGFSGAMGGASSGVNLANGVQNFNYLGDLRNRLNSGGSNTSSGGNGGYSLGANTSLGNTSLPAFNFGGQQ